MTDRPSSLRYGVLLDSTTVLRWQSSVLDELDSIDGVECVVAGISVGASARPTVRQLWRRERLAWTIFNRAAGQRATSITPVDIASRLANVPTVPLPFDRSGAWQTFSESTCDTLSQHRPDFLLRFGFGLINGPVLDAAPMGVWSFHHGDERGQRGGPPCFWELFDRDPITGVLLQRLNERIDGGVPLARAFFPTIPHSYRRNRDQAYLGAVQLPAQVCRRVLAGESELVSGSPSPSTAPVRRPPDGKTLLRFLPRLGRAWIRRQIDGLTAADRWHVGIIPRPIETFLDRPTLDDVAWLPRPKGADRYVADPFGCETDAGAIVLVEDYDHKERHGRISAYRLGQASEDSQPQPVHEFEVHASYPYLVQVEGEWWCIPETTAARQVVAHRFDPERVQLHGEVVLLEDVALADPTLFGWDDLWWLFGTDRDRGANTHLRGWWAEHPSGPWHQHAIDPLAIDVRNSRGAGTPFVHDGRLYRPAQDCTRSYGGAVALNHIEQLDPIRFQERVARRIGPDSDGDYPDGVHTLSALGQQTLVDGTLHRFSLAAFRHELSARGARLLRR